MIQMYTKKNVRKSLLTYFNYRLNITLAKSRKFLEAVKKNPYRVPLEACSRSMASNKALKFPLPNDRAPLR